jgi:hypothetical protein
MKVWLLGFCLVGLVSVWTGEIVFASDTTDYSYAPDENDYNNSPEGETSYDDTIFSQSDDPGIKKNEMNNENENHPTQQESFGGPGEDE